MKTVLVVIPVRRLSALLLFVALFWTAGILNAAEFDRTHIDYDALLKRFVAGGRVDYKGLQASGSVLDRYLKNSAAVSETTFHAWPATEQLAFLMNLYNATTLKLILNHYPITSIKKIGNFIKGPWDQEIVQLFGKTITLDTLEHSIIRKDFKEPRIHLALVCAAKGCPPLRCEAYVAEKLNAQLDDQSRVFLASPAGLRIDRDKRVVYFSSIFKWYGKDFVDGFSPPFEIPGLNETQRAVAFFSSQYLSPSDGDFLKKGGYSVEYLDYDWSLNEK